MAFTSEAERAGRHRGAKHISELDHVVGSSDLENVDRGRRVRTRDDRRRWSDLANGERNIRVDLIVLGRDHESRLFHARVLIGGGIVKSSDDDAAPFVVEAPRLVDVLDDEHVGQSGFVRSFD